MCGGTHRLHPYAGAEEIDTLFTAAGLVCEENGYDKRLIVNRKEEKQMYRCWLQCKYRKQAGQSETDTPQ